MPGFESFSHPDNVYELATLLMLEECKSRFEKRSRRVHHPPVGRLNLAPQHASPF